jgi:hypothetical protein
MIKNEPSEIRQISEKFYGIYRGVIEDDNPRNDSNEEYQDGRVRIRVWGLHTKNKTDIPTKNLPLAQPAYPVVIGSITGKGIWSVPVQGTHVFVFFENGDHMQPRYFATAPGIEPDDKPDSSEGFADPDGTYPLTDLMSEPDMNRLMYSNDGNPEHTAWENLSTVTPVIGNCGRWYPSAGSHEANYPNNFVIETKSKQTLEMNSIDNDGTYSPVNTLLYNDDSSYILMNGGVFIKGGVSIPDGITTSGITAYGSINGNSGATITGNSVIAGCCSGLHVPLVKQPFIIIMVNAHNDHTHNVVSEHYGVTSKPIEQMTDGAALATSSTYVTECLRGS